MGKNGHENCIRSGVVEPGYLYRKKMLYYTYLNPIEESKSLKKLKDDSSLSAQDLEAMGYGDDATVLMKLSLLKLPKLIQHWISEGRLKPTIGYLLYSIKDKDLRISMARRTMTERLSCRSFIRITKDMKERGVYSNGRPV